MAGKITQSTLIPLSFATLVIGGGAAWMTKMNIAVEAHAATIIERKALNDDRFEKITQSLEGISVRLSRIEGNLDVILKRQRKSKED